MKKLYNRHSIRIKEYDYSKVGSYFITICTQNRRKILLSIQHNGCRGKALSLPKNTKLGDVIKETIEYINKKYYNIKIMEYVIMPNHIHMIIEILGKDGALPLQDIVRIFKTYTTKRYYEINMNSNSKLWQRNYFEHIIRNEKEYLHILEYIENNPIKWDTDEYNC